MAFIPFSEAMYIHHGVTLGGVRLGDSGHSASTTGLTLEAVMFKIRQKMWIEGVSHLLQLTPLRELHLYLRVSSGDVL
jgi:hypothetical protein